MSEIPEKPYYKINEVCQYTDTQPYMLRFWESEFPQLSPEKSRSGQSIYRRRDIDLVLRIKQLLQDDEQSISVAREILDNGNDVAIPEPPPVRRARPAAPRPSEPPLEEVLPQPRDLDDSPAQQESLAFDSVPRGRYDDAVEEIQHLKLELADAEKRARKAESAQTKAEEASQRLREKNHRAAAILEELIDRLG